MDTDYAPPLFYTENAVSNDISPTSIPVNNETLFRPFILTQTASGASSMDECVFEILLIREFCRIFLIICLREFFMFSFKSTKHTNAFKRVDIK